MWIELLRDYRGIKINDELWLKGIYEVPDDLGNYLIGKGYAQASNAPPPPPPAVEPPDAIAIHNEAVDDLGLPSHLKVPIEAFVEANLADDEPEVMATYDTYTRDELLVFVERHAIEVEGTGKDGHITKQNLVDALEAGGV